MAFHQNKKMGFHVFTNSEDSTHQSLCELLVLGQKAITRMNLKTGNISLRSQESLAVHNKVLTRYCNR